VSLCKAFFSVFGTIIIWALNLSSYNLRSILSLFAAMFFILQRSLSKKKENTKKYFSLLFFLGKPQIEEKECRGARE
jgi:hypothetical protein